MESISIVSFLSFLVCSTIGAYWHYRKLRSTGRHRGSLIDYLRSDYPRRSVSVGIALVGYSWGMATTGTADFINVELMYSMLKEGDLHIASIGVVWLAIQSGYSFDSMLNKGSEE